MNLSPILVFQMGRVGSNSVEHSLRNAYLELGMDVPVYHAHYMSNFALVEARARQDLPDPSLFIRDLELAKEQRKTLIDTLHTPRLKVISLVRDIIARNISTFFFALSQFILDWEQKLRDNDLTIEYLHQVFLEKHAYEATALNWFEEQLKPTFDLDVYATPFPKEEGYKIYSSAKADLLVMRLESLKDCANKAIQEFLGLSNFELSRVNTGGERITGELQQLFAAKALPREYVERMYSSMLMRHFYSVDELNDFTRYWVQTAGIKGEQNPVVEKVDN